MTQYQLATKEDLQNLKRDLVAIISKINSLKNTPKKKWIKSAEVRKMLGISASTLQTLRINGTIPYTKLDKTLYYDREKINEILTNNASK